MGIRFLCPNGHKLNVKAFLAGKRGICPQCDAKFLVPVESGGQAPALEEVPESALIETAESESVSVQPPAMPAAAVQPPAMSEQTPPEVWFVRSASGDQFGPASIDVMQGWVAEGRVATDCWVWRTGWAEWKAGDEAIALLNGAPPPMTVPETEQPVAPVVELANDTTTASLPEPTSATAMYRSSKRSRQERARKVTFFLGGVVLLLVAVLVVVLIKNSG